MTTSSASLPHSAERRRILTSDRIRGYGSMIIIVNALALALTFFTPVNKPTVFGGRFAGDFVCFYIAGGRVRDGLPLYDLEAQDRTFHALQPNAGDLSLPYVYAPFFSVIFVPLAFLPLKLAFAIWTLISLALYIAGFHFAWEASGLPSEYKRTALIAALAFLPFSISMLGLGQVVSFGIFALGLSLYLESKKPVLSGMVLALLLFKPTLLILIIPMLFVTRRFRVATGLLIGGTALGLLNLLAVGLSGMFEYAHALSTFGRGMTASPLGVNLSALIVFFAGRPVPVLQYGITLAVFLVLITAWIRRSPASWALAITFTPFLSPYAQIYDSTYIILGAILTAGILYPSTDRFRFVLCALFLSPVPALFMVGPLGLPFVSLSILALGCYQLTLHN